MNEYTMALVNDLRVAERRLSKMEAKLDILMALVAKEEIETDVFNKAHGLAGDARISCKDINAIFGWPGIKEGEDEG